MITHRAIRFVDRDMFMRYRGSGIGHKYMRKIEEIFENMSRERIHHKERKRASSSNETVAADAIDSSDDEHGPEGSEQTQAAEATEGDGGVEEDDEGDDSDYEPVEADSGGSGSSDGDSDDSESEGEVSETYRLGAL